MFSFLSINPLFFLVHPVRTFSVLPWSVLSFPVPWQFLPGHLQCERPTPKGEPGSLAELFSQPPWCVLRGVSVSLPYSHTHIEWINSIPLQKMSSNSPTRHTCTRKHVHTSILIRLFFVGNGAMAGHWCFTLAYRPFLSNLLKKTKSRFKYEVWNVYVL